MQIKKILRVLLGVGITGYLLVILFLTVPGFAGIYIETVTSGSMAPRIPVGSVIFVQPVSYNHIHEGDVITYYLDENLTKVTHRVISCQEKERTFITKGDANQANDAGAVLYENVEGKVILTVPLLGRIAILLTNIYGKLLLISIMMLLFALEWLVSLPDTHHMGGRNGEENI